MHALFCLLSLLQYLAAAGDVTLVFAGDAMQHDRQIAAARSGGVYDYSACFANVADYVESADYAVVNLECSLGGKPYTGYPCFSAPDSFAMALRNAGFDLFLHANNHCLDRRDAGLVRTLDVLDEMRIPHIGTYRCQAERDSLSPYIVTVKGMKIVFLNYTYGTNGIKPQKEVIVDYIDKAKISADIRKAKKRGAELIVACMHWGVEYKLVQNKEQEQLAVFLEKEGVDLIIGGHPHVVQPMELRDNDYHDKKVLVAYSLGNFISAMRTADTRGGVMLRVVVGRSGNKPYVKGADYKLVFVNPPSAENANYRLVTADDRESLATSVRKLFDTFMERARGIFRKYNIGISEEVEIPGLDIAS